MVTMLLGGLWHGANWTFVVWGALHGIYLVVYKIFTGVTAHKEKAGELHPAIYLVKNLHFVVLTYLLVLVTWLLFRSPDIGSAAGYFMRMFAFTGGFNWHIAGFLVVMFIVMCIMDLPIYISKDDFILEKIPIYVRIPVMSVTAALILLILFQQNVNRAFIYFQF